jgi:hypothetical protein
VRACHPVALEHSLPGAAQSQHPGVMLHMHVTPTLYCCCLSQCGWHLPVPLVPSLRWHAGLGTIDCT